MSTQAPATSAPSEQQLANLFQYTVEIYKTFEKFAESLPNPLAATMFKQFAADERGIRDLLEMKIAAVGSRGIKATLSGDLAFADILEGDMSYRESAEFLIAREKTMQKKLDELTRDAPASEQNLLIWINAVKRAHMVELERELALIRNDRDWWKREDAEWRIVHGSRG